MAESEFEIRGIITGEASSFLATKDEVLSAIDEINAAAASTAHP